MGDEQPTLPGVPVRAASPDATHAGVATGAPAPRLRHIDRTQLLLRSVVVEELIAEDHPARAIWAFVGRLDLTRYLTQVKAVEGAAGRPPYDPQLLVSLWVYSYSRGVTSARAMEQLCEHDPAYQWLAGMERISAHTLSDFRVDHAEALHDLFVQVLGVLSAEGLITLERVMQDGTRIRASAASSEFRTQSRITEHLEAARAAVAALDAVSEEESSRQQHRARERAAREKRARLEAALQEFDKLTATKSTVDRVSTTDPDARVMKQADGGTAPSYNVQIATDAAHSLIVDIEATQAGSDYRQLLPAVDRIAKHLQATPDQMVVDGGYISNDNILAMADRGINLIGPEPRSAPPDADGTRRKRSYQYHGITADYEVERFIYNADADLYVCPQGRRLVYDAKYPRDGTMRYRYQAAKTDCDACPAKRLCCPRTKHGRSIERREPLAAITAYRQKMQTDDAKAIDKTRSQIAEFPNLWIKAKLALSQFRVRGVAKVRSECVWAALTYDIQQWIRLRWRPQFATTAA
jgi:transposase